ADSGGAAAASPGDVHGVLQLPTPAVPLPPGAPAVFHGALVSPPPGRRLGQSIRVLVLPGRPRLAKAVCTEPVPVRDVCLRRDTSPSGPRDGRVVRGAWVPPGAWGDGCCGGAAPARGGSFPAGAPAGVRGGAAPSRLVRRLVVARVCRAARDVY